MTLSVYKKERSTYESISYSLVSVSGTTGYALRKGKLPIKHPLSNTSTRYALPQLSRHIHLSSGLVTERITSLMSAYQ